MRSSGDVEAVVSAVCSHAPVKALQIVQAIHLRQQYGLAGVTLTSFVADLFSSSFLVEGSFW